MSLRRCFALNGCAYGDMVGLTFEKCRFEAFDEPWKVIYNTPTDGWETDWGLMDSDRNLKSGLTIPDCDGKTVS